MATSRMKRRVSTFAAALLATAFSGVAAVGQTADDPVVALLVVRDNHVAETRILEVLPLATRTGGSYRAVVSWEVPRDRDVVRGDSVLAAHPEFAVFRRGERVGSLQIEQVVQASFDCSELYVGRGPAAFEGAVDEHVPPSGAISRRGFMGGQEVSYTLNVLLALSEGAPAVTAQERAAPVEGEISPDQRDLLLAEAARRLGAGDGSDVRVRSVESRDFDADGTYEHVVVAAREQDGAGWRSVVLAGRLEGGEWRPLLAESHTNSRFDWGEGYRLLDVLNLDGDAVPELVFEVGGYEATTYRIFEFTGEGFRQVFSHVAFGC